jgi:glycosyltransferase involved in cell wall biosynthesis
MPNSTNDWPNISVVMNCYNSEAYVREAIDSVIAQTYPNWEIIFWDNQSADGSAEIVKSYCDDRIKYFYATTHTTLGEARNLAVEKSSRDWIAFLDCDDLWLLEKLENQVEIIKEESRQKTELGFVYAATVQFYLNDKQGKVFLRNPNTYLPEGRIFEELLMKGNFVPLLSAIVRRELYWKVGGIPKNYQYSEDYYLFAAIASISKCRVVREESCYYRIHSDNLSKKLYSVAHEENLRIFFSLKSRLSSLITCKQKKRRKKYLISLLAVSRIYREKKILEGIKIILLEGSVLEIVLHVFKQYINKINMFKT